MMVSWTGELRASREKQFDISCSLRWQDLLMHVRGGSQGGLHQLRQERPREECLKCGMKIRSLVLDISFKFLENIQVEMFLSAGGTTNNSCRSCYFSSLQ